jgi:hypothetical protein
MKSVIKEYKYDDIAYTGDNPSSYYDIVIPNCLVWECDCGNLTAPDCTQDKITQALREKAGILDVATIDTIRDLCSLTAEKMGEVLDIPDWRMKRILSGAAVQNRDEDNKIRSLLATE